MDQHHVILLQKNLTACTYNTDVWLKQPHTRWIALGHFDEIYLYKVNHRDNLLHGIQQDRTRISDHNDGNVYYHPLYLVPSSTNHLSIPNLQIDNEWFVAIVRIHFALSKKIIQQFDDLQSAILNEAKDRGIPCSVCYATEFSDMVLDVRSSCFRTLIDFVLTLRKHKEIGKMYTYFGINASRLNSRDIFPNTGDTIPFFSMRFSGSNISETSKQLEIIKDTLGKTQEYSVNGVDDILLLYHDLQTIRIIDLYRKFVFFGDEVLIQQSESTTRIGIRVNVSTDFSHLTGSDLLSLCDRLLPLRNQVSEWIHRTLQGSDCRWFQGVSELVNSLIRMAHTPVMDEAVYLVAPGVEAFLAQVLNRLETNTLEQNDIPVFNDFIENCIRLLEHLMRMEGQLSQNPEMRPPICDVPVFMLEYTEAFLSKVSVLLQLADTDPNKHHIFFLAPCSCQCISAMELFPATRQLPGLVQLMIPEKLLYTPKETLQSLCHEISHYVGEEFRHRSARKEYFARACGAILTEAFFDTKASSLIWFWGSKLFSSIKHLCNPRIREMSKCFSEVVVSSFYDEYALVSCLREYAVKAGNVAPVKLPSNTTLNQSLLRFQRRCEDMEILFREVFADICMLHILNIQVDDYLEGLLKELSENSAKVSTCEELFAARIFVSLYVCKKNFVYHRNNYRDVWTRVRKTIIHLNEEINQKSDGVYKFPLPISSVLALVQYAQESYNLISQTILPGHTKEVQDMFTELAANSLTYRNVLSKIDDYRSAIS